MVQICNMRDCQLEVFKDQKECVLHCEKHSYNIDWNNLGMLRAFDEELARYIADFIFEWRPREFSNITLESLLAYLLENSTKESDIFHFCKEEKVIFNDIFFPCRDARDPFDYFKILKK